MDNSKIVIVIQLIFALFLWGASDIFFLYTSWYDMQWWHILQLFNI
jgi:hypothetical protein